MKLFLTLASTVLALTLVANPRDSSRLINTIDLGYAVNSVDFSDDGNFLAIAGEDTHLDLYYANLAIKVKPFQGGHTGDVLIARFSPGSRLLATGGTDDRILIWDVASARIIHELTGHNGKIEDLSFSPNGFYLASAGGGNYATIWNLATGERILNLPPHPGLVTALAFSSDGEQLLTACKDQQLRSWNVSDGRLLKTVSGHNDPICDLDWSTAANLAASSNGNEEIDIWNTSSSSLVTKIPEPAKNVYSIVFNPDGTMLGTGGDGPGIKLWDMATGQLIMELASNAHPAGVAEIGFNHTGSVLVSCGRNGMVKFWEVPTLEERVTALVDQKMLAWLRDNPAGQATNFGGRARKIEKERKQFRGETEEQLTNFFVENVAWEKSLTIGAYVPAGSYFQVNSDLLGPMRLLIDPKDVKKLEDNRDRIRWQYLRMKLENGRLQPDSVMAFLKGMQRRYEVRP